jgi:protein-disulfide isomerase
MRLPGLKRISVAVLSAAALSALGFVPQAISQVKPPPSGTLAAKKTLGSPSAPIIMEVFADFQCPQCRNFFLTTTQQLINSYVDTGKLYIIHHDFPLNMHSHSKEAAEWANAAAEAGKFADAERVLYEKQDTWGATGQIEQALAGAIPPPDMKLIRTAEQSQTSQIDAAIQSDMALGNSRGVNGTPTIFITHKGQTTMMPQGGVSYELLKPYLDYLLVH